MIKRANITMTAKKFVGEINKGNVLFDCPTQRNYVWDNPRKSLLMRSMILNYPIPPLYFTKLESGEYDSFDCKQRSNAVSTYMNGDYPLCDDLALIEDEKGKLHDFSGMFFKELPEWARDAISDYPFTIEYLEGVSDEVRDDIIFCINNGQPFSAAEKRRVKAKSFDKFQELSKHMLIKLAVSDKAKVRYNHENLAMQAWAIIYAKDVAFNSKNFDPIIIPAEVTDEQVETISKTFSMILGVYSSCEADGIKGNRAKRFITKTHIISLVKAASIAIERGYDNKRFEQFAKEFFSGASKPSVIEQYNEASRDGAGSKHSVNKRITAIVDYMTTYFAGNNVPQSDPTPQNEPTPQSGESDNFPANSDNGTQTAEGGSMDESGGTVPPLVDNSKLIERIDGQVTGFEKKVDDLSGDYQTNTPKRLQEQRERYKKIDGYNRDIEILSYIRLAAEQRELTPFETAIITSTVRDTINELYERVGEIEYPKGSETVNRMKKANINTVDELKSALAEYEEIVKTAVTPIDNNARQIRDLSDDARLKQGGDIQFTPSEVTKRLVELANITGESRVLEPSAGIGDIADEIKAITPNVDVVEIRSDFRELLQLKGYNVAGEDFIKFTAENKYDAVIMNPPFSKNQDMQHLRHAFEQVKDGGTLVCITSAHWTNCDDKKSIAFREWIETQNFFTEELPSGTFDATGARSMIVVIKK